MKKNKEIKDSHMQVAKEGQCKFFVLRKKRLCRMTVRPGRQYCGEHEPPPDNAQADKRVPCPNDAKHTVYVSKLEKHLSICNARAGTTPPYIVPHVNTPTEHDVSPRVPLALVPRDTLIKLIEKINLLYDEHVKDKITSAPEHPIHSAVVPDFNDTSRTESSLRHLRQVSQLMWLVEDGGLVDEDTCYVELGAGKGQLSYYMGVSWCSGSSRVLPVDRAALRHKRERRGRGEAVTPGARAAPRAVAVRAGAVQRLRADLAHLALDLVPHVAPANYVVGLAKHLCGVATDYAISCVVNARRARALLVATCCHHRCEGNTYLGKTHLQELGISGPELNIMLGVVSWATCGDGRSRDTRLNSGGSSESRGSSELHGSSEHNGSSKPHGSSEPRGFSEPRGSSEPFGSCEPRGSSEPCGSCDTNGSSEPRRSSELFGLSEPCGSGKPSGSSEPRGSSEHDDNLHATDVKKESHGSEQPEPSLTTSRSAERSEDSNESRIKLSQEYRETVGRRAKALLDWGRVLWLRAQGFEAGLCYYVPTSVSLENVCIIAKKL